MSCFRFTVRYFICRNFLAVVTLISVLFLLVSVSVLFLSQYYSFISVCYCRFLFCVCVCTPREGMSTRQVRTFLPPLPSQTGTAQVAHSRSLSQTMPVLLLFLLVFLLLLGLPGSETRDALKAYCIPRIENALWAYQIPRTDYALWAYQIPRTDNALWTYQIPRTDNALWAYQIPRTDNALWAYQISRTDNALWAYQILRTHNALWAYQIPRTDNALWTFGSWFQSALFFGCNFGNACILFSFVTNSSDQKYSKTIMLKLRCHYHCKNDYFKQTGILAWYLSKQIAKNSIIAGSRYSTR